MRPFSTTHTAAAVVRRHVTAASTLAILAALVAPGGASAANYTAGTEAELKAAITAANADSDPVSTITLTGGFNIATPSDLPAIGKPLTIDAAGFTLTAAPGSYNVAAGATLTFKGDVDGSGALTKSGQGTLVVTGADNHYAGNVTVSDGQLRVEAGGQLTLGSGGRLFVVGNNASVIVTGIGSRTEIASGNSGVGSLAGSTLTVEAGASFVTGSGALNLADAADTIGTLNVRGLGTTVTINSGLAITRGTGFINITDGAKVQSNAGGIGGAGALVASTGTGTAIVSGTGSSWTTGQFGVHRGSLSVLDGGLVSTSYIRIGIGAGKAGTVLVSGKGSELIGTLNGAGTNFTEIGNTGSGTLTIANEGKVTVGVAGAGTVKLASTGSGTLNIGGGTGQAATQAGTLNAARLLFGAGAGVVNLNHTDSAYAFDVALDSAGVLNRGTLNQIGSGKTILTANQLAFTGKTNVLAGILEVNGSLGGTMDVLGGRLQGTGTVGATRNAAGGTIAPGNSIGTLTIAGDYTSDGGALEIEAVLGNDSSAADLLLISGNSLLGLAPTLVSVINVGGLGAETIDGIKIVDVGGVTSDPGAFVLNGPAIGGAYSYKLFQNDLATGLDGDWYLRSDKLAPTTPTFENYPLALLGMIELPTLRQRVGDRTEAAQAIWTRIEGAAGHHEASDSSTAASYDSSLFLAQIGLEYAIFADAGGSLVAGLTAQYSSNTADVTSSFGDGRNTTESLGIGANLTWRGNDGTYADLQAQFAGFSTDLDAIGYSLIEDNAGSGFAVSLEVGHEVELDDAWSITPQAQLSYASVSFDSFTDHFGSEISLESGESLFGRLGLSVDYQSDWRDADGRKASAALYGIGNLTYKFLDGAAVVVSGTGLNYQGQKFGAELGLGGTIEWADGAQSLHGELLGSSSFEGSYALKGTLGFGGKF